MTPFAAGSAPRWLGEQGLAHTGFGGELHEFTSAKAADQSIEFVNVGEDPYAFFGIEFVKQAAAAFR
jgi:hypothetical protein